MLHWTAHAHMTHGLVAAGSTLPAGRSSHIALHSGERRLRCEEHNHSNGDELEEPLHPIKLNHSIIRLRM